MLLQKVITAAHCVHGKEEPHRWQVQAGHIKRNESPWNNANVQVQPVARLSKHP